MTSKQRDAQFIDLRRGEEVSSLRVKADGLIVVGELPHGIEIAPRSVEAADAMILWLEGWKGRQAKKARARLKRSFGAAHYQPGPEGK